MNAFGTGNGLGVVAVEFADPDLGLAVCCGVEGDAAAVWRDGEGAGECVCGRNEGEAGDGSFWRAPGEQGDGKCDEGDSGDGWPEPVFLFAGLGRWRWSVGPGVPNVAQALAGVLL